MTSLTMRQLSESIINKSKPFSAFAVSESVRNQYNKRQIAGLGPMMVVVVAPNSNDD